MAKVQRDQCGKPWRSRLTTNSTTSSASSTSTVSASRNPPLCSTTSKRTGNARKRSGKHDACVRARSHHTRSPSDHHTIHRSLTVTGLIRVYSRLCLVNVMLWNCNYAETTSLWTRHVTAVLHVSSFIAKIIPVFINNRLKWNAIFQHSRKLFPFLEFTILV